MTKQETYYIVLLNKKLVKKKGVNKLLDIPTSNSIVAVRLKEIINQKGLKQTAIAINAGFTPQELNDMLNGRRIIRAVDISAILKVLHGVGIDANDLFDICATEKKGE